MTPEELQKAQGRLTRYGHHFDNDPERYLPAQLKTKAGKIRKRQPPVPQQHKSYWQSQCSFRGLKTSGTVEELQALVRNRDRARDRDVQNQLAVIQESIDAEHSRLKAERKAAAQVKEDQEWPALSSDSRLFRNTKRWLRETFGEGKPPAILVLSVNSSVEWSLHDHAHLFGAVCRSVQAPPVKWDDSKGERDFCVVHGYQPERRTVIGTDLKAVVETAAEIARQGEQAWAEIDAAAEAAERAREAAAEAAARERYASILRTAMSQSGKWDLTGTWSIHCDDMEDFFDNSRKAKLSMAIYEDTAVHDSTYATDRFDRRYNGFDEDEYENGYATYQPGASGAVAQHETPRLGTGYFAVFDFSVIEGVMRINGEPGSGGQDACQLTYRWRGRETGENMIEVTSDELVHEFVFSDYGTKLRGSFEGGPMHKVHFTGEKIKFGANQRGSSATRWHGLSEAMYNAECTGRWH